MKINNYNHIISFCALGAFIYILPLLLANVYYIDDLRRSLIGIGWNWDGRPLSSFMMSKLTGGGQISDYFPYSIILSAVIVALSGYIISHVLGLEKGSKYKLSAFILLINPFFLENLSYRWDSLPMAVSVFAVIFPFLFFSSRNIFILSSIVGINVTLLTYQASIVIYPLTTVLLVMAFCFDRKEKKEIGNSFLICLVSFVSALLIYVILNSVFSIYSGNRNEMIFFTGNFVSDLSSNAANTWDMLSTVFSRYFTILLIISAGICIVSYIRMVLSSNTILNKILIPAFTVCAVALIPSVLIALKDPWITPRMLVGFSFLIYLVLVFTDRVHKRATTVLSALFIIIALPLMASYANALRSQDKFEKLVAHKIAEATDVDNKYLVLDGRLDYAPETHVAIMKFPLLYHLVPSYFRENWKWGFEKFRIENAHMYFPIYPEAEDFAKILQEKLSVPIVDETPYYILRADSLKVIVDFNKVR